VSSLIATGLAIGGQRQIHEGVLLVPRLRVTQTSPRSSELGVTVDAEIKSHNTAAINPLSRPDAARTMAVLSDLALGTSISTCWDPRIAALGSTERMALWGALFVR
jgi:hypothetical protein